MVQRPDDDADAGDEPTRGEADPHGDAAPAGGSQRDVDERWAQIVADLGEPGDDGWPQAATDGDDERREPGEPRHRDGRVVRPAADERVLSGRDWDGTAQYDAAEEAVDADEHFVPPDPGPVLTADPLRALTWVVAIGVPVLYVVMLLAWRDAPGWLAPVAGALFLGAVGILVWRMPHRRDREGGDSGAVV